MISSGHPYPLGATPDGDGCNFALYTEHATSVELCLFQRSTDEPETHRFELPGRTHHVRHGHVKKIKPGQLYGYRVLGPYAPQHGHRFNPNKLLIDPYARLLSRDFIWHDSLFAYPVGDPREDLAFDHRDSSAFVPKSVVLDPTFDWRNEAPLDTPWRDTIIYECHVRGMTKLHPEVPPEVRGTYLAFCTEPIIDHLKQLGVTAVEFLPVCHALDENRLWRLGLTNYWGYSPITFFAPTTRHASAGGDAVQEFKTMVRTLHRAGIEVILDVVYNHTGESGRLGPTVCFRGIDNAAYYRINPEDRRQYQDVSGCGNAFDVRNAGAFRLIFDSLRYWVQEMHVDGFRFDLATALARTRHGVEFDAPFFAAVAQDPVLSRVKLIAEPWDVGLDGYGLGAYPIPWAEWNDKYRTTIRSFWRGDPISLGEVARRLSGSSDVFEGNHRTPCASINFVTAHDGFTLHDLVSYERKHNEANQESNRDGINENQSCNWGVEGPTQDQAILALREKAKRNLLATLTFSLGIPMLTAGDEMGRTQCGNNNAYCQDNEISWVDWRLRPWQVEFLAFTKRLIHLRRHFLILRRCRFWHGEAVCEAGIKDATWLAPYGREMTADDWNNPGQRTLGILLHEHAVNPENAVSPERGPRTEREAAYGQPRTLLLIANADSHPVRFNLPIVPEVQSWRLCVDTNDLSARNTDLRRGVMDVAPRSMLVLQGVA